jgi:type IV pilus assembly protein PilP
MKTVTGFVAAAVLALAAALPAQERTSAPSKSATPWERTAAADGGKVGATRKSPAGGSRADSAAVRSAIGSAAGEAQEMRAAPESGEARVGWGVRRDPFRPINLNLRTSARRRENLSPLERYDIGQLRLVGIIWDIKNPTALVEDSSGLGYTVKIGTAIGPNEGKVKAIKPDGVIIEEEYIDLYGTKKRQEVSMKLPLEKSE